MVYTRYTFNFNFFLNVIRVAYNNITTFRFLKNVLDLIYFEINFYYNDFGN